MNIVDGLALFMARKKIKGKELARILECSDSSVSLYLSGKSGISLEKLSMLFRNGMTLEEAFSNFTPEVGDMVKNSDGSSEYDSEWGWFGDVENLVPGHGFMYYSSSTVAKILVFQTGRK